MSAHTGRADDRPKSILEDSPESHLPGADGVVEVIGLEGVLSTQLDQLPHQLISFNRGQLIPRRSIGLISSGAEVMNVRFDIDLGAIVVGDADAQISLFHGLSFLSVPLLEHLKYITNIKICQSYFRC